MTLRTLLLFVLVSTFYLFNRCQTEKSTTIKQSDSHTLVNSENGSGPDRFGYLCTLHICRNGELLCNGVLVHPEMVLTAHYCFERLGQDFDKNDIVVRCGTRDEESKNLKSCIANIRWHDLHHASSNPTKNAIALIQLAEVMNIETPNLAQPETPHKLDVNLRVVFWKDTGFDDVKSDLGEYMVTNGARENCTTLDMEANDPADYLCATNMGDSCADDFEEQMLKGGAARALVSTDSGGGIDSGRNKFDLVFGIEANISKPCTDEETQKEFFIPVFDHTSWILDAIDELQNPKGCVESVLLDEDVLFECFLDACGNDLLPPSRSPPLSSIAVESSVAEESSIAPESEMDMKSDGCLSEEMECIEMFEDGLIAKAVEQDKVDKIKLYLSCIAGCAPEIRSLLPLAAEYDSSDVARVLLEAGEDVNVPDAQGFTALHYVAQNNSEKTLPVLLKSNPDLSPATTPNKMTPVHLAAYYDSSAIISRLAEEGADVNARNAELDTPLHFACAYGHVEAARVLLEANAVCALRNLISWTPFDAICRRKADCDTATVINLERLLEHRCH